MTMLLEQDEDFETDYESDGDSLVSLARERTALEFPSDPPTGFDSWGAYMAAAKRTSEEVVVDSEPITVLETDDAPDRAHLGRTLTDLLSALEAADWRIWLRRTVVHYPTVFYQADSKRRPGQEQPDHRRGEVKSEARDGVHWWLRSTHPSGPVGFAAEWEEGVTPKGARSFLFQGARAVDPVGMPIELLHEYSAAKALRTDKYETNASVDARQAALDGQATRATEIYNDGASYLERRPVFESYKEFRAWLDEWLAIPEGREL